MRGAGGGSHPLQLEIAVFGRRDLTRRTNQRVTRRHLKPTERDDATHRLNGLDYFGPRSSEAQGRFTSPDPIVGWPDDPHHWGLYS